MQYTSVKFSLIQASSLSPLIAVAVVMKSRSTAAEPFLMSFSFSVEHSTLEGTISLDILVRFLCGQFSLEDMFDDWYSD